VQQFDKLVQEDLNIGTGPVWITSPGGGEVLSTQVGLHSFARGQKQYTATWAPGAIAAGSSASTTLAVPDCLTPDFVLASHDKILTNDLRILGNVSADGTVRVVIHNPTSASVTVASGTVAVLVLPGLVRLVPFTLIAGLAANLAGPGPTLTVTSSDLVNTDGDYNSFGISESEDGPFTTTIDLTCPVGDRAVYIEGRYNGSFPLVLEGLVILSDPTMLCP